ncbi:MAG TPA: 2-dehydropantoate 2-reductase [Gammaproteobacteria bacterium]|nr:2-dehydropantoate 2-reductase [Gammaproteobacteria bacterium]
MSKTGKKMKLVILGAGGIGCYYGARLLANGNEVTFIARGEHLAALQRQGLRMRHPDFGFDDAIDACDLKHLLRNTQPSDFDALIVCIKATATHEVALDLHRWFDETGQKTAVVSLQNGVDNEGQLVDALGADVVIGGLAVRIGGHIVCPGTVEATGVSQVVLGAWPGAGSASDKRYGKRLELLVDVFEQAQIPTRKVNNIRHELWKKLIINNGVNPLSALTGMDTRTLSHHPDFAPLVLEMMRETAKAAAFDDETLTEQEVDEMFELIRNFDAIKTSMLVDFEKGRQLEVDAISGAVLQRNIQQGKSSPYTQTVYALLKHRITTAD